MSGEYMIVKANAQPGIDGVSGLEAAVAALAPHGWQPAGGPFYDSALMRWCQSVYRLKPPTPAGEVSMREPAKVEQQPGALHVHADPKDGPLRMREPKP